MKYQNWPPVWSPAAQGGGAAGALPPISWSLIRMLVAIPTSLIPSLPTRGSRLEEKNICSYPRIAHVLAPGKPGLASLLLVRDKGRSLFRENVRAQARARSASAPPCD